MNKYILHVIFQYITWTSNTQKTGLKNQKLLINRQDFVLLRLLFEILNQQILEIWIILKNQKSFEILGN